MRGQVFRNLDNYKKQQQNIAKSKGVYDELMRATTLTEARIILYGRKDKSHSGWKGHAGWLVSRDAKFAKRQK